VSKSNQLQFANIARRAIIGFVTYDTQLIAAELTEENSLTLHVYMIRNPTGNEISVYLLGLQSICNALAFPIFRKELKIKSCIDKMKSFDFFRSHYEQEELNGMIILFQTDPLISQSGAFMC
jgi:hypothetical protein